MQTDWLFHGIVPFPDAFYIVLDLGIPALVLLFLAWSVEQSAKRPVSGDRASWSRFSYRAHPRVWNLTHRLLFGLAVFLATMSYFLSFGFLGALLEFMFFAVIGATSRSLQEVVALDAHKRQQQR